MEFMSNVAGMVDKYETSQYQLAWQNNINFDYGSLVLLYDYLKEEIDTTSTDYSKDNRDNNGFRDLLITHNLRNILSKQVFERI